MKTLSYISALIVLLISAISCNDDFLSENQKNLYFASDTLDIDLNLDKIDASVNLPLSENTNYRIYSQPKWLTFDNMHGKVTSGNVSLSITVEKTKIPSARPDYGTLILDVEDKGFVSIIISYTGNSNHNSSAHLQCSVTSLNFVSVNSQSFTITNNSQEQLGWYISGIPSWLTFSVISGSLNGYESKTISASVDFSHFSPGQQQSTNIQIIGYDGTVFTIPVHAAAPAINPADTSLITTLRISGIVTDAEFNHETGIMAICTKSPNALIIFNSKTNAFNTLPLDKTPNCISLSEDGSKAAIGYTIASVIYVDIQALSVTREFPIDVIPYDIVLGENGWCYIAASEDQWIAFRSLNLSTGTLISGKNMSTMYEKTIIRKIPGKPYLVGTRMTLSPSGILIFDISKGIAGDTISYYHESIGRFFISNDGTKLYASSKKVYSLPAYDYVYHPFAPPVWGQIESTLNYLSIFDECPANSSIFVSGYNGGYYSQAYSSQIEQFNTTNLNKIKTYKTASVYIKSNGIATPYNTEARFIFASKDGSSLFALKNLEPSYSKEYWSIEVIKTGN